MHIIWYKRWKKRTTLSKHGHRHPPVEVHGFIPVTENMPGGDALKPGDVLKAFNGKTIEVLNTDAEGRLILADALSFTSRQKLDEIIDIATLTGAISIALGEKIAGLFGDFKPARTRQLLEWGRRDARQVLKQLEPAS